MELHEVHEVITHAFACVRLVQIINHFKIPSCTSFDLLKNELSLHQNANLAQWFVSAWALTCSMNLLFLRFFAFQDQSNVKLLYSTWYTCWSQIQEHYGSWILLSFKYVRWMHLLFSLRWSQSWGWNCFMPSVMVWICKWEHSWCMLKPPWVETGSSAHVGTIIVDTIFCRGTFTTFQRVNRLDLPLVKLWTTFWHHCLFWGKISCYSFKWDSSVEVQGSRGIAAYRPSLT